MARKNQTDQIYGSFAINIEIIGNVILNIS